MEEIQQFAIEAPEKLLDRRFAFWCALMVFGFAYVASMLCKRPMPFSSSHEGGFEFAKLMIAAPFLYLLGPCNSLRTYDGDGEGQGFFWNALLYAVPFFIGLNWFFLQRIPQINYDLTPDQLSHMKPIGMMVFGSAALFIVGLAVYHARLARREGILPLYLAAFFSVAGGIALISYAIRREHPFHIHHYFLFGFFVPFARFKTPLSIVCQAVCAGIYVEGISEWSMAPLWM